MKKPESTLYIVATPIGNLGDITERAIHTLQAVDCIAAEDTRHSQKLLQHFNIRKPLVSLHEHNEQEQVKVLLAKLQAGQSLALISDAGTPLISDPGYRLVQAAQEKGIRVVPIPGASAAITALSASGLPSDRFIFEGFLPVKSAERITHLQSLYAEKRTMIFYEAPQRLLKTLDDMIAVFGADRLAVIARELTKLFESIEKASLKSLKEKFVACPEQIKGEFVLLVQGTEKEASTNIEINAEQLLAALLTELPLKQAALLASKITGEKKNYFYKLGLRL